MARKIRTRKSKQATSDDEDQDHSEGESDEQVQDMEEQEHSDEESQDEDEEEEEDKKSKKSKKNNRKSKKSENKNQDSDEEDKEEEQEDEEDSDDDEDDSDEDSKGKKKKNGKKDKKNKKDKDKKKGSKKKSKTGDVEKGPDDFVSVRVRQFRAMMYKNWLLIFKHVPSSLLRLLIPVLFITALWALSTFNTGDTAALEKIPLWKDIPRCTKGPGVKECLTIAYAPQDNVQVRELIEHVRTNNNPPIPASEVRGFDHPYDIDDFMLANKNTTQGAYLFPHLSTRNGNNLTIAVEDFQIGIQLNYTLWSGNERQWRKPFMVNLFAAMNFRMMEAVLDWETAGSQAHFAFDAVDFVKPPQTAPFDDTTTMGFFMLASFFFHLVFMVNTYVGEKESRLRLGLKQAGLKDSVFWTTWFLTDVPLMVLSIGGMAVAGYFFNFGLFIYNDWQTYTLLFVLFCANINGLAMLLSSFINRVRIGNIVSFILFIVFIIGNGITSSIVYSPLVDKDTQYYLSFVAPVIFQKGLDNLLAASISTTPGVAPEGIKWADIATHDVNDIYPLEQIYWALFIDWACYIGLAWYLDNVLPNEFSASRTPWFFLTPSYWTGRSLLHGRGRSYVKKFKYVDDDVEEERTSVMKNDLPDDVQIVVKNLRKVYKKFPIVSTSQDFEAVKDICFYIERNSLFCLLGPNGAGKTTTLSIMTGLFPSTSGDATINGYSVRDELDQIRKMVGVCPQFDILWKDLTGAQHLRIYALMRGVKESEIEDHIVKRLEEVHLMDKANVPAGSYSGGMQRRLSVAISMCGDPPVVFMDEPTTGMDPVARRQVWDIIENAKKGRAIILTTHSMEEADVLSDKIGIMARGEMKCIGTSLHLKNKFGSGYRLILMKDSDTSSKKLKKTVLKKFSSVFTEESSTTNETLTLNVYRRKVKELPNVFKYLNKSMKKLGISDFTVSMTSLEDVFLAIVRSSKDGGNPGGEPVAFDDHDSDSDDDNSDMDEESDDDDSDSEDEKRSKRKSKKSKKSSKSSKRSKSKRKKKYETSSDEDEDDEEEEEEEENEDDQSGAGMDDSDDGALEMSVLKTASSRERKRKINTKSGRNRINVQEKVEIDGLVDDEEEGQDEQGQTNEEEEVGGGGQDFLKFIPESSAYVSTVEVELTPKRERAAKAAFGGDSDDEDNLGTIEVPGRNKTSTPKSKRSGGGTIQKTVAPLSSSDDDDSDSDMDMPLPPPPPAAGDSDTSSEEDVPSKPQPVGGDSDTESDDDSGLSRIQPRMANSSSSARKLSRGSSRSSVGSARSTRSSRSGTAGRFQGRTMRTNTLTKAQSGTMKKKRRG